MHQKDRAVSPSQDSPHDTPGPLNAAESDELFRCAPVPILIEDWSRIKQWVDDLKESGVEHLDRYLDAHPTAISELRALHSITDANDAALSLFDAESKAQFFSLAKQLLPANRPSNGQVLQAMFDGRMACQGERTLTTLTGRKVPMVWSCSLPRVPSRYSRLHFYGFNISEYQDNVDKLQALRAEMARTARISLAGQLAASITHEISQPLSATRTAVDAALRWITRDEPEIEEAISCIQDAARWARDTTELCRSLRGFLTRTPVRNTLLSAEEILDSAIFLIAPEANANDIEIVRTIEPSSSVYADRIQAQQVLTNLLLNGMYAIRAVRRNRHRTLSVHAAPHGDSDTLFEVTDTGAGIEGQDPGSLFQPFASTKADGMGMGLAISRSIVEAHGGRIWIAFSGPQGTRFCFTLPRSE